MAQKLSKHTEKELIELGEMLINIHDLGYVNKRRALTYAFLKGMATGVGAFLGGTIVVALLFGILSLLGHVPLLDRVVEIIQEALRSNPKVN